MSLIRFHTPTRTLTPFETMSRVFDDFLTRPFAALEPLDWRGPVVAVDEYETDDEVVVKAEVPGVKKEDLQIRVEGDTLTIRGETRQSEDVKDEGWHRHEMRYGAFHRSISLPVPIKQEEIKAKFEDGILTIRAPKNLESVGGKQITIE